MRSSAVSPAPGSLSILFAASADNIQNGAPDGIALVDTVANTLLDALSYEGSIKLAIIAGVGTVSLGEGNPTAAADKNATPGSLARIPNGIDTNDAAADWRFTSTLTPGAANVP